MPIAARRHRPHRSIARTHRAPAADAARAEKQRVYRKARWLKERRLYLQAHPLCVECERMGRVVPATIVDHVIDHAGIDDPLAWDSDNWQALCQAHHNRKTAATRTRGGGSEK